MDVLTGYTTGIHPRNGEQDCAVQLLEHLGAQRRKHAKKLYSAVQRDGSRLRRKLKKAEQEFARLQMRAERNRRPVSEPSAAAIDMGAELASPPRLNRSNLHPFRLKVKELRNVLKLAETPDWDLINALGDVKDAIGEWHDSLELVAIAEKALDHGTQCKLIQQLKTIASDKYEMALSQAEKLRKRYVGSPGKKKPSRSGIGTPSEPVLRAAMKLVA
jgi:CHAD domain-containing protein